MLRRYLITNAVSTVALYGAFWALVPSMSSVTSTITASLDSLAAGQTLLAPVLNRIITVAASIGTWF